VAEGRSKASLDNADEGAGGRDPLSVDRHVRPVRRLYQGARSGRFGENRLQHPHRGAPVRSGRRGSPACRGAFAKGRPPPGENEMGVAAQRIEAFRGRMVCSAESIPEDGEGVGAENDRDGHISSRRRGGCAG